MLAINLLYISLFPFTLLEVSGPAEKHPPIPMELNLRRSLPSTVNYDHMNDIVKRFQFDDSTIYQTKPVPVEWYCPDSEGVITA